MVCLLQCDHGSRSRSCPCVRCGGHGRFVNAMHRLSSCPWHSAQSRNTDTATRTSVGPGDYATTHPSRPPQGRHQCIWHHAQQKAPQERPRRHPQAVPTESTQQAAGAQADDEAPRHAARPAPHLPPFYRIDWSSRRVDDWLKHSSCFQPKTIKCENSSEKTSFSLKTKRRKIIRW